MVEGRPFPSAVSVAKSSLQVMCLLWRKAAEVASPVLGLNDHLTEALA